MKEAAPANGHWEGLECDWDASHRPADTVLEHGKLLLTAARAAQVEPEDAGVGYWPTLRLFWRGGDLEVEVHEDSFELYNLAAPSVERAIDIRVFPTGSEADLTALIEALRSLNGAAE